MGLFAFYPSFVPLSSLFWRADFVSASVIACCYCLLFLFLFSILFLFRVGLLFLLRKKRCFGRDSFLHGRRRLHHSSASASLAKKQCGLGFLLFLRSLLGHGPLVFNMHPVLLVPVLLVFLLFFITIVFLHSLGGIFSVIRHHFLFNTFWFDKHHFSFCNIQFGKIFPCPIASTRYRIVCCESMSTNIELLLEFKPCQGR